VTWAFARAHRLRRRRDWVLFALAGTLGLYTHYFMAVLLAVIGVWLGVESLLAWLRSQTQRTARREIARLLSPALALGSVGVAFLPWYLYAGAYQLSRRYDYPAIPDLDLERLGRTLLVLLTASPRRPTGPEPPTDWILVLAILGLAVVGFAWLWRRRPVIAGAMLSYVVVLIPFAWAADQRAHYFVSERQFITIVPFLLIAAGIGAIVALDWLRAVTLRANRARVARAGDRVWAAVVSAAVIALALVSSPGLGRVYAGAVRPHEDWRAASAFVEAAVCPGARIYSNVSAGFAFGVGVYAPDLRARAVYLQEKSQNEYLGDVLARYPIAPQDVVVILRDRPGVYAPGRGNIETIYDYLSGTNHTYRTFTDMIRVFVPYGGCPPG
jgi:hypothetical protein